VKLFDKKVTGDSLRSLNEEEIQKKLYGTFHKTTTIKNTGSSFTKTVPFMRPKLMEKKDSELLLALNAFKNKLFLSLKSFPWKFSLIVIGLVISSVYSFQFFSTAIHNFAKEREAKKHAAVSLQAEKAKNKIESAKDKSAEDSKVVAKKADEPVAMIPAVQNENPLELPKKPYYAVQICTYQKESDAKGLSGELKKSNFDAFYLKMQGPQNKVPYFVVFLGKDESYSGANRSLKEFRRSEQFQKFPDAFIRSL